MAALNAQTLELHNGQCTEQARSNLSIHGPRWEAVEFASGAPYVPGRRFLTNNTAQQQMADVLNRATRYGFTIMRTWAFPVSNQWSIMPHRGEYNEAVFRGLDWLLNECRVRGIKVRRRNPTRPLQSRGGRRSRGSVE